MLAVAREIEKLQAELSSMEKRARAAAAVNPSKNVLHLNGLLKL